MVLVRQWRGNGSCGLWQRMAPAPATSLSCRLSEGGQRVRLPVALQQLHVRCWLNAGMQRAEQPCMLRSTVAGCEFGLKCWHWSPRDTPCRTVCQC